MAIAIGVASKGTTGSASSQATTGVATQAAGSTFVVGAIWNSTQTFTSIADNKGNSANYVQIGAEITNAGGDRTRWYYVQNGAGGAGHTATITIGGAASITVLFLEITGGLTAGILDQSGGRADAATPFTLAAGLTTTQADELLVAALFGNSGSNPATHAENGLGAGSSIPAGSNETNGASFWTACYSVRVVSATAAYNPSFTETGGSDEVVRLATFKASGAAATTRGTPFGHRGTAFNGGRALHGIVN